MQAGVNSKTLFSLVLTTSLWLLFSFPSLAMYQEEKSENERKNKVSPPAQTEASSAVTPHLSEADLNIHEVFKNLGSYEKWLLASLFRDKDQVQALASLAAMTPDKRSVLYAYIFASPSQKNTAATILISKLSPEMLSGISLNLLPVEPDKFPDVHEEIESYWFNKYKKSRFLPHVSTEQIVAMALVLMHAKLSGHFPDALVYQDAAQVCDPAGTQRCIAAIISLLGQTDLHALLTNATSLEGLGASLQESITEGLQNSSLSLSELDLSSLDFTPESFLGLDRTFGALTEIDLDIHRLATFVALTLGVSYGPPIMRAILRPLFVTASNWGHHIYGRAIKEWSRLPGTDRALGLAIRGQSQETLHSIAKALKAEDQMIEISSLVAGLAQKDVRDFLRVLNVLPQEHHGILEESLLPLLKAEHQLLSVETDNHGHLINDINDLIHGRGDRNKQIANIGGTVSYVVVTALVIYGLIEWMTEILGQYPDAALMDANFAQSCINWSDRQVGGLYENDCTLVDGVVDHVRWPGNSEFAFEASFAVLAWMSPSIRSFFRFGFRGLHHMGGMALRLALFAQCCLKPVTDGNSNEDMELIEVIGDDEPGQNVMVTGLDKEEESIEEVVVISGLPDAQAQTGGSKSEGYSPQLRCPRPGTVDQLREQLAGTHLSENSEERLRSEESGQVAPLSETTIKELSASPRKTRIPAFTPTSDLP